MTSLYGTIVAFQQYTLDAGALSGITGELIADGSEPATADVQHLERPAGTAEFSQATVSSGAVKARFKYGGSTRAKRTLLRMLDFPHTGDTRTLRAYRGDDVDPVLCYAEVSASEVDHSEAGHINVTFMMADPYWRAVEAIQLSDTATALAARSFTAPGGAIVLPNRGDVRALAQFRGGWTAQHAATTANVGWKYRRRVSVRNDSGENWYEEPFCIDLGDTAAWVTASKALSSGDDVVPVIEGTIKNRTLVNFNSGRTFMWFFLTLPDGETAVIDTWYGNPSSSSNHTPNLSTRSGEDQTYIGFDLEGVKGTATNSSTSSTLVCSIGVQENDRYNYGHLQITGGTGSGQRRRILDTAYSAGTTTFTVERNFSTTPDSTSTFVVWMSGVWADGGRVTSRTASSITDNAHTNKWGTNSLQGATVTFFGGSGATPSTMTVLSNTADTLTFTSSFSVQPAVNDSYYIERLGVWSYVVDTAITESLHRGLYRENRYYTQPSRVWSNGDTPGGFQVDTYLPNGDDYAQFRPYDTGSGGGHAQNWWPLLRGRRRRGQERTYKNEGNGDGLSLSSPFGFQAVYWDWQVKNVNGVGKAVMAIQEGGGESWVDVVTYSTTQATLTAVAAQWADLSSYTSPSHIGFFALPADTDTQGNIPSTAKDDDEVEVRTNDVLRVFLDLDAFGLLSGSRYVVGSEAGIYDYAATLRIGGGNETDKTPVFDVIRFGHEIDADGEVSWNGHKIGLRSTEELWVTTDPSIGSPLFAIYDTGTGDLTPAEWAGVVERWELGIDGEAIMTSPSELLPLPTAINLVENGEFADQDVTMWTMTPSVGVTATKAWVATPDVDGIGGSMEIDITATPAGPWTIDLTLPTIDVLPNHAYDVGFWRQTDTTGSGLDVTLTCYWNGGSSGDADTTIGGGFVSSGVWYHGADGNHTFYVPKGLVSPYGNVTDADITITISGTTTFVGTVNIDAVTLGVPALHIAEVDDATDVMGTLTIDAVYREAYLG